LRRGKRKEEKKLKCFIIIIIFLLLISTIVPSIITVITTTIIITTVIIITTAVIVKFTRVIVINFRFCVVVIEVVVAIGFIDVGGVVVVVILVGCFWLVMDFSDFMVAGTVVIGVFSWIGLIKLIVRFSEGPIFSAVAVIVVIGLLGWIDFNVAVRLIAKRIAESIRFTIDSKMCGHEKRWKTKQGLVMWADVNLDIRFGLAMVSGATCLLVLVFIDI